MRTRELRSVEAEKAFFQGLPVAVVAARLEVTEEHVHDLIRQKKLKAVNVGLGRKPLYRVHEGDFQKFIDERTV